MVKITRINCNFDKKAHFIIIPTFLFRPDYKKYLIVF